MTTNIPNLYARVVSHVQSSGTGKSRAHDELAKGIFYIPLNLAAPGTTTYPPRDPKVGEWFDVSQNHEQQRTRDRCHAFLHALLSTTLFRLKNICDDKAVAHKIETEPRSRLKILASEFRNKMAEGRVFEEHGEYRRNFYDEVYRDATENMNHIRQRSTASNTTANPPLGALSPQHKFPVRTRGSKGKDTAGRPDKNNDNKLPVESRRVENQLTTAEVAREIILLLNPERKSNDSPQVVISWDESHSLLQPIGKAKWTIFSELRRALRTIEEEPILSVFLSTVGNFEDFSPATKYDPSMRLSDGDLESLPPITEVSFDQFAEKVDCIKETWMLARIASTHQMAHLGRALFPTRFDNGDFDVKKSIVTFAAEKLLCRPAFKKGLQFDEPDESLACLAVRLGLDFKDTSWLDKVVECRQVERHMRICLAATEGFRSMVTISPSEPLLAEASWMLMSRGLGPKEAPQALLKHIDESYLNAGDRGEVIAALLLMLARDEAIQIRKQDQNPNPGGVSSEDLKDDGVAQGRIVTMLEFIDALVPPESRSGVRRQKPHYWSEEHLREKSFESAFTRAHIYFNHFIKVHDFKMVERGYLWRLICRGAAVIGANNQRGVDIIIPVLMGTVLHPKFVTAIFVQVKNDRSYTDDVSDTLFTGMDPCKVKLFTENGTVQAPA
ncbi:hypothetical protein BC826DRAFT_422138 [Russula brevipes]|nr:hypothetical protein BC826DRAFT_422138 [Russula brevipes]